ncbi:hypothetical protein OXX69_005229 [Metschnikowia pulcherrima]
MASVAHVLTDLAALAGEARRKNQDVRSAIDNAHVLAKTLPANAQLSQSSESQTVFCAPFLLALQSQSTRLVSAALPALSRLVSSHSLCDSDSATLVDTLYHFDGAAQPMETQLKMLQVLPAVASVHMLDSMRFVRVVAVISRLAASPNVVVANTASATLQQVVSALFDGLRSQKMDQEASKTEISIETVPGGKSTPLLLDDLELRCHRVISDLSDAFLGKKLAFFTDKDIRIRPEAALEILENVFALNKQVFAARLELTLVLKSKTAPGLLHVLNSPTPSYALTVRALRLSLLIISMEIPDLADEIELLLASTNHILLDDSVAAVDDDANASTFPNHPYWQKALVAEFYRAIFTNFGTVKTLFHAFDAHKHRKSVLKEIFVVINSFVANSRTSLFTSETVQIPAEKSEGQILSKATVTLKTPMMDHLDRHDPPPGIPELYAVYMMYTALLGFADGVSAFVFGISANANAETLEADVDFVTALNETIFGEIAPLFRNFLFCSLDSDCFHSVVRALQKYTHAIGLLGLSIPRDNLLGLLSESIVKSTSPNEERKNSSNLLALGGSLVETLSTIQPPFATSPVQKQKEQFGNESNGAKKAVSRNFNSRQVICLRAFSNLAISLGSTLQDSWEIVWTTFQWVDFFLEGPEDYGSFSHSKDSKRPAELKLSAQDMAGITSSQQKLMESLAEYQLEPFREAFTVLATLYNEEDAAETDPAGKKVTICPFNKSYFLKCIKSLSTLNFKAFSFMDSDLWAFTSSFFENLAGNRSLAHQKRAFVVECYTMIINDITRKGFAENGATDGPANKSLDALFGLLNKLLSLGRAQELLVLSCETDMHLTVLETLHSLIDDHDKCYQNSWDMVFKILGTAFVNTEDHTEKSTKLVDKIVLLISTSFDSLKMILDEFLSTLPFNQIKALIDTLLKFCSQKYDLNISFSAVSYFWLISDCIHANIAKGEGREMNLAQIKNLSDLESLLQTATDGSPNLYQALNIYLLANLSRLSADERDQVREGAIQTLFQILDVQDTDPQLWELVYDIVFPALLDLENIEPRSDANTRKAIMPSLNLVLSGLVSVYAKFMMDFGAEKATYEKFWERLLSYMSALLGLRWNELNTKVFQSFQDVLLSLRGIDTVPKHITNMLFSSWVNVPVDYDFVKPEYQEALALFNESFKDLYPLIQNDLAIKEVNSILAVLNKCARYPVLKPGVDDSTKPSKLQLTVVENLVLINNSGPNEEVSAAVIQQLAQIAAYPYEVRSRIKAKLKSKFEGRLKIPTFIAVAQFAFDSVCAQLLALENLNCLFKEERFHRIMGDLLDIVRHKAPGVISESEVPLWMRCNDLLSQVVARLIRENIDEIKSDTKVWECLLECVTAMFEDESDDEANVKQYEKLSKLILPVFFESGQSELIRAFVQNIYFNSFLYKANHAERELLSGDDDFEALTNYKFEDTFGTTSPVEVEGNRSMRMTCLEELFEIAGQNGPSATYARGFVAVRAAFSIRRFIADARLSGKRPLPKIQEDELLTILHEISKIGRFLETEQMHGLLRLLTQSVVYADKIQGMDEAIQSVFQFGIMR